MQEKLWLQLVLRNKSVQISDHQKTDVKFFTSVFFLSVVYFLLFSFCLFLPASFLLFLSHYQFPGVTTSRTV